MRLPFGKLSGNLVFARKKKEEAADTSFFSPGAAKRHDSALFSPGLHDAISAVAALAAQSQSPSRTAVRAYFSGSPQEESPTSSGRDSQIEASTPAASAPGIFASPFSSSSCDEASPSPPHQRTLTRTEEAVKEAFTPDWLRRASDILHAAPASASPAVTTPASAVEASPSPPQQRMLTPRTEESPDLAPAPTHEGRGTLYLVLGGAGLLLNLALLGFLAFLCVSGATIRPEPLARSPLALPSAVELNADDWVPQIYHTPKTRRNTPRALPAPLVCTFQWRAFRCVEGCTFKVSNLLKRRLCTARGVDEKRRRN